MFRINFATKLLAELRTNYRIMDGHRDAGRNARLRGDQSRDSKMSLRGSCAPSSAAGFRGTAARQHSPSGGCAKCWRQQRDGATGHLDELYPLVIAAQRLAGRRRRPVGNAVRTDRRTAAAGLYPAGFGADRQNPSVGRMDARQPAGVTAISGPVTDYALELTQRKQ